MREDKTLVNILLTVITGLPFSIWKDSTAAGIWMGMATLSISVWVMDIASAISSHREKQAADNTTKDCKAVE